MDSADPRTQPTPQPKQQPHHHQTQHHQPQPQHPQQRQPQQPLNDQQQQQQPQPHHMPQQLTQPQLLHQQQQITHPTPHAQQSQPTGYALPQHNYSHQMQVGHGYHPQQPYTRNQYGYAPNLPATTYSYPFVPSYNHQHTWAQQPPFTAVPVSTPPLQTPASTLRSSTKPAKRKGIQIIDPKTMQPIDLSDSEAEKSTTEANNATKATTTTTTAPTKIAPTQQAKASTTTTTSSAAAITTTGPTSTPEKTQANKNPAAPVSATITNNNVTNSSNDRTEATSPSISVSNLLLQKVSEDTSSEKREEAVPVVTVNPEVAPKAVAEPPATETKAAETPEAAPKPLEPAQAELTETDSKEVVNSELEVEATDKKESNIVNNVEQSAEDEKLEDEVVEECDGDSTKKDDYDANGEIKLHYEKGQYNPTSDRNGKKKYSRQFMLDVCEKICKLDLNSEASSEGGQAYNLDKSTDPFCPPYHQSKYQSTNRQNDAARRQNPNNYAGRSSAGQERQRKVIVPSSSLTNEVELKTVSNPWRPGKEVQEEVPDEVVEVEKLRKKFRSILNKLTPQNFDNLATAVTELNIDTETKLGEVIDIVFAKALAEPGYCVLYGQMCSHLKKITAGATNFGMTLLKRCQNQFQADIYNGLNLDERRAKIDEEKDPDKRKQLDEELYEDMFRCRLRGLGLIKFIGELYKIEMLIDPIMFDCISRLLSDSTSEESLECLCDLLRTIGAKLDKSSQASAAKQRSQKNPAKTNAYQNNKSLASVVASSASSAAAKVPEVATLDPIFEQLHKIRKNKDLPLSVRIRFKLLDVCELREKDNWLSKGKDNNPKKLDEIKKDHLEAERQKSMGPRKSQEGRRMAHGGGGSSNQISSLGNDSNRNNYLHPSASSQSIRDHAQGEKILQSNSDNHKAMEQHRKNLTNVKDWKITPDTNDKMTSLRPHKPLKLAPYSNQTTSATATSNTTKSTTTNSTNASVLGGGGQ